MQTCTCAFVRACQCAPAWHVQVPLRRNYGMPRVRTRVSPRSFTPVAAATHQFVVRGSGCGNGGGQIQPDPPAGEGARTVISARKAHTRAVKVWQQHTTAAGVPVHDCFTRVVWPGRFAQRDHCPASVSYIPFCVLQPVRLQVLFGAS